MRVVILTHIFWPEPADFKNMALAKALVDHGHEVTVIAPFPNYPTGRIYDGYRMSWRRWQFVEGVRILRLPLYPDHSASGLRRMVNYLSYTAAATVLGPILAGPTDVVFVYSPPMTLGLAARAFKTIRRAKVLLDVVDLWPEAVAGSGMTDSGAVVGVTGWFARQAYRTADAITVLTRGFQSRVTASGVRITVPVKVRYPWSMRTIPSQRTRSKSFGVEFGLPGHFCVIHAGNLGPYQNMGVVLEAAELLRRDPTIRIVLVGGGRDAEGIGDQVRARGLTNVVMTGSFPSDKMPGILAWADACLVSLKPDPYLAINMPSKVASYLAAGKPLVVSATGETADLVTNNRVGLTADPTNPADLAHAIRALAALAPAEREAMGLRAMQLFDRDFDAANGIDAYVSMLEQLGSSWRRRRPWRGNGSKTDWRASTSRARMTPTPTTETPIRATSSASRAWSGRS